jgi:hypothetical protein
MRLQLAAAALAVAFATACESGPVTQTSVGQVISVDPDLVCLSLIGPIPACYEAEGGLLQGIEVGDCVQVMAVVKGGRAANKLATAVEPVSADRHSDVCSTG